MDRFMTRRATPAALAAGAAAAGLPDSASVAVQPQDRRVAGLVTLVELRLVHAAARHTGLAYGWNRTSDGMPISWRSEVEELSYVGAHDVQSATTYDFHLVVQQSVEQADQVLAEATATATLASTHVQMFEVARFASGRPVRRRPRRLRPPDVRPLPTRPARPGRTRVHRHGPARRPTSNGGPWTSPSPSLFATATATAPAPAIGKGPGRTRPCRSSWTA
ncbi:hypothetical protein ACIRYZ_24905 [Kitasatospora sp. NPDC101155]|uniref:hypothetical protein n=1 Tax=Kitasatospora sp. NPDC101155 TaxID=3364097 RepID=UPI00380FB134